MADLVEGSEEFVEKLVVSYRATISETIPPLLKIWTDLWDDAEKNMRFNILENHLKEFVSERLENICKKEHETMRKCADRSELLIEEIEELKVQLGVPIEYLDVEKLPLHRMAEALNDRASRYRQIRDDRIERLKQLRQLEESLCGILSAEPFGFDEFPVVPSESQLKEAAEHIQRLQAMKSSRMDEFLKRRKKIIELYAELGETPKLQFDMNVVLEEAVVNFVPTQENMEVLEDLFNRLVHQLDLAQERRQSKVDQLQRLWSYLEEPVEKQEDFLRQHSGCTSKDLQALQSELERCNKQKQDNIGKFVERIRRDLEAEWERCLAGRDRRSRFSAFTISTYSEDLYELHEAELERWKTYYSLNKNIFDLYNRHKSLFLKLIDLDGLGKNATRYQNRGGKLLQEERQRKIVSKDLPKVEEELKAALAVYENDNGAPFFCLDKPLRQVIDDDWHAHFDERIIEKFRGGGGDLKIARTPVATKRRAPPTACSTGAKYVKVTKGNTRNGNNNELFCLEPTYDEFQKSLKDSKMVSRSTEVLSHNKNYNVAQKMKSTPNIASPKWAEPTTAPKTVPRLARRQPNDGTPQRTQTRRRLPLIL